MKLTETTPKVKRSFTLELTEQELLILASWAGGTNFDAGLGAVRACRLDGASGVSRLEFSGFICEVFGKGEVMLEKQ